MGDNSYSSNDITLEGHICLLTFLAARLLRAQHGLLRLSQLLPAVPGCASTECEWASSAAYSANGNASGAKGTTSFVVPERVDKIKFEVVGGAGGTNYPDMAAGSGAKVTGIIEVKPGQTVQLVGAAGGIGNNPLTPAEGGEGYGNGGSSSLPNPVPSSIMQQVNTIWPASSPLKRITYSASGGGSSALVIDGTPVAVAGGGGGAGFINNGGANNNPDYMEAGAVTASWQWPEGAKRNGNIIFGSTGGSADGASGSAGQGGFGIYDADSSIKETVEAGEGGANGIGGTLVTVVPRPLCTPASPRTACWASTPPTTRRFTSPPSPVTRVAKASRVMVATV